MKRFLLAVCAILGVVGRVEAVNNTVGTATQAVLGQHQTQAIPDQAYYGYYLSANRSYVAFCSPSSIESSGALGGFCHLSLRDGSDAVLANDSISTLMEPFAKAGAVLTFTPTTSGVYFLRTAPFSGSPTIQTIVMETTLSSPWYFVSSASGYDAFIEIRNTTIGPLSVTVRAYGPSGSIAGSTTVSVPANGGTFVQVGATLGVTGNGSLTITHNGMPGAIEANGTTLSGVTGLSFDAPFRPRMEWSIF